MVGCGGFGAANAGAAIMVRAAAKEPAIVALAKTFLEFMAIILFPGLADVVFRWCGHGLHHRLAGESGGRGSSTRRRYYGRPAVRLRPPRHDTVLATSLLIDNS